ncbi:DUF6444 domain-containing protein [Sorangium sp. So ce854]|uniref:DUF6444 domain-containing protein n=1 Tax=Sorangium sp. So ce854 TaxID=3133322 RepID=UPI003F635FE3
MEDLERENAQLRARVDQQQALIAILEHRNQDLEARLARFSGNSSKPPSSDPPGAPPPAPPKRGPPWSTRALPPAPLKSERRVPSSRAVNAYRFFVRIFGR